VAVEDDYADLARQIVRVERREDNAEGRQLEDMRVQMDALWRQRRARRGYRPDPPHGTGPSGPTGPGPHGTGPGG
jgi:hypothetical protein